MKMYNCHTHIFLDMDVPDKFLPFKLVRWIAKKDRPVLNWLMHNLNPFTPNDLFDKYQAFMNTGKLKSQWEVLNQCSKYYPVDSKFIVLAMDLAYMGAGKVPRPYEYQLAELANLGDNVLKFVHIDPRRENANVIMQACFNKWKFSGVKLYPSIGYYPYDIRLDEVYEYCEGNNLPIISHCSPNSPVHFKGSRAELIKLLDAPDEEIPFGVSNKELCARFAHPQNYSKILERYPDLNICIAHFGSDDWEKYIQGDKNDNWVDNIITLIMAYDNCWTDISFTMWNQDYWPQLKVLFMTYPKLLSRTLFGSDFYVNQTVCTEREWSVNFRAYMGEHIFNCIAEINPVNFLKLNK